MQQAVMDDGEIRAFTWIQSIKADVYSGLASARNTASSEQRWHRQLQSGCIYSVAYISFLTDGVNPFVSETQECHINLLFHYDNCVLCRIQCGDIKPIVYPQACWRSLGALAAIITAWFTILKPLSSWFSFYVNTQLQDHVFSSYWGYQSCGYSCPVTLEGGWTFQTWSCTLERRARV